MTPRDLSKKYHFMAIGGIGQSALAKMLLEKGYTVSGSDISESKYLNKLKDMGAKVFIGHKPENVPQDAKVVLSTAIAPDNPELMRAKQLGLEIIHRSDMLKILSDDYDKFIGFSGTHGKTTTSGFCAYILEKAGLNPSFAIGGIVPEVATNAKANNASPYFVAELDESDGTILKYSPYLTVINNLEADHFDFFKDGLTQVLNTFNTYIDNLKPDAKVVVNMDDEGVRRLKKYSEFLTFSLENKEADYFADNIEYLSCGSSFEVYSKGKPAGRLEISLPGVHNIYNALAVFAALTELGIPFGQIAPYFKTFTGMGRRFQLVTEFNDIKIIDDYAHHPTEILATLKATRQYTKNRIVAVFQPHRYTRFQGLWNEFLNAFENSDLLIVTDVYAAGEKAVEGYTSKDFVSQIKHGSSVHIAGGIKEAGKEISKLLKPSDTVLTFGAGDITKMGEILNECHISKIS